MVAENLKILTEAINEKCVSAGRTPDDITLIAVSKYQPVEAIIEAFESGVHNFGENKAQELKDKSSIIEQNVIWHFIGHLQTNKVKYIIEPAEYIHSVDSIKLAAEIQKRAAKINKVHKIFLEIKTSDEATKFGISGDKELDEIIEFVSNCNNLNLNGLMTMAPYTDDESLIRRSFSQLRELKERLNAQGLNLEHLSMGMSNDWGIAIEEGATMLRIGTAIFGKRNYK